MKKYAKFIVAAAAAGAVTAQAAISDGTITPDEWWKIVFTAIGAVFVLAVPNAPQPDLSRIEKILPPSPTTYQPQPPRPPSTPLGRTRHRDDPPE